MWLFGKKKEKAAPAESPKDVQVQNFALNFLPEEINILAVTGTTGIAQERPAENALWTVGMELTAWMEENEEEIHRESKKLVTLADDRLAAYLREHIPANFIIKAKVRPSRNGNAFQLIGMPEPGFDPDLKAFLNEQKKPVTLDGGSFGMFTLVRRAGCFQAETQWQESNTSLILDQNENADACLATAKTLFAQQELYGGNIRECAAEALLQQGIDYLGGGDEEEHLSREELMEQLEPDDIQVCQDGSFHFTFGGGGVYWGKVLVVSGSVSAETLEARMEG